MKSPFLIDKSFFISYYIFMDVNIFDDRKYNNLTVRVISDDPVMEELILEILSPFAVPVRKNPVLTVVCLDSLPPEIKGECIYIGKSPEKLAPSQVLLPRPLDIEELVKSALGILKKNRVMTESGWGADMSARTASYKDTSVSLSQKEMELYVLLLKNIGQCVSREMIAEALWGGDAEGNAVDVYVCYLRKKLEGITGPGALVSVRGRGYMLKKP